MHFDLEEAISILERTPTILKTYLEGLSADWTSHNEGAETWSPFDIIGHLIVGEKTDWVVRAEIILADNPDESFEPFDMAAQFNYGKDKILDQLLAEFESLRIENLQKIKAMNLTDDRLLLTGVHPEFGKVTLKELLATWVAHDLGHIAQISRVMAKQYGSEVGPWRKYLGILKK
jgi:uncharacterized damage-inducible protein DinB